MNQFFNIDLLSVGITVAASIILGFIVYFRNTASHTSRLFLMFTVVNAGWSTFNYLTYHATSPYLVLWFIRLVMFFAVMQTLTFLLLMHTFPAEVSKFPRWIERFFIPVGIVAAFLALTPLVFSGIKAGVTGVAEPIPGPGIALFGIVAVSSVVMGIWFLVRKMLAAKKEERLRFRFLLLGVVIMFALIIVCNFIFPAVLSNSRFIPLSAVFTLPFILFTAYGIIRHGLLDVKVISTEILVFVLASISFFEIILSSDPVLLIFRIAVFLLILSFGVLLMRSVFREVKLREELQTLSKQLTDANVKLKQLDEAKSQFLSVASHQLRTPLTAIKGYVSMLIEGDFGAISPQQQDVMSILFDSSQRLVELISDLLDLSRIESGTMEFSFEAVDLCKIVDSVIEEVRPKTEGHKLYLFFDNVNRSCPMIRADAEKMRQVIINLIDNAVKYTVQGGVTVRLHEVGSKLRFEVADTGIGIDPADQPKLFQKFFRTEAANTITREGTGLGIYVVQKLVTAMQGKIWFESPGLNKGTTFIVEFDVPSEPIKPERIKIDNLF